MKKDLPVDYHLFFIWLTAFLIRLIGQNQSLWLDEGTTAKVVQEYGFTQIIAKFSPHDFHPPLYYLFMKLWTSIFGLNEISLRFPSVIFSLLTGLIIYKICRLRKTKSDFGEPLWAMVFFLFNPLIIYYSQEARMYMMATFFLTVSLYYLLKILNIKYQKSRLPKPEAKGNGGQAKIISPNYSSKFTSDNLLLGLFLSLSLLTFYGSVFFIAVMLVYLLYKRKYKLLLVISYWLFGTLMLLSPLFIKQFINTRQTLPMVVNWSMVLGKANIKNLLLIPIKFTSGRISWEPKITYYLISGLWLMFIIYLIIQNAKIKRLNDNLKFKNNYFFLYLLICPLFLGFITSFVTPMLQYFRFLYLIPIMCLLLSFGLSRQANLHLVGATVAIGFFIFSLVYLLNPSFHREDWKSLAGAIPKNATVYAIHSSMDGIKYYNKNVKIKDLRTFKQEQIRQQDNKIIVIPYTAEIYGINYKKTLKEEGLVVKQTKSFRGLTIENWVTNSHKR